LILVFFPNKATILTTPVKKSFLQMGANCDIILISNRRGGNGKRSDKEYPRGSFRWVQKHGKEPQEVASTGTQSGPRKNSGAILT
jgi:hypothetical protein